MKASELKALCDELIALNARLFPENPDPEISFWASASEMRHASRVFEARTLMPLEIQWTPDDDPALCDMGLEANQMKSVSGRFSQRKPGDFQFPVYADYVNSFR